jgi:hypothetical protein
MREDVEQFCLKCDKCIAKTPHAYNKAPLQQISTTGNVSHRCGWSITNKYKRQQVDLGCNGLLY